MQAYREHIKASLEKDRQTDIQTDIQNISTYIIETYRQNTVRHTHRQTDT